MSFGRGHQRRRGTGEHSEIHRSRRRSVRHACHGATGQTQPGTQTTVKAALLIDAWGTYIELTEGLGGQ